MERMVDQPFDIQPPFRAIHAGGNGVDIDAVKMLVGSQFGPGTRYRLDARGQRLTPWRLRRARGCRLIGDRFRV